MKFQIWGNGNFEFEIIFGDNVLLNELAEFGKRGIGTDGDASAAIWLALLGRAQRVAPLREKFECGGQGGSRCATRGPAFGYF